MDTPGGKYPIFDQNYPKCWYFDNNPGNDAGPVSPVQVYRRKWKIFIKSAMFLTKIGVFSSNQLYFHYGCTDENSILRHSLIMRAQYGAFSKIWPQKVILKKILTFFQVHFVDFSTFEPLRPSWILR